MPSDPRLQDIQLLTLAAYRLQQRQQRAVPDWRYSVGMSALLEAARHLPRRGPWELPDVESDDTGLGRLLREARQWEKEHPHGA
jgi:hypothetical protein